VQPAGARPADRQAGPEADRYLKRLSKFEVLIIDDSAYVQQSREEMEVLFTLLAERYERGSVMITSNLPFSRWESIFKDPMTNAAAIDRFLHHSVILELNVPSYQLEQAQRSQQTSGEPAAVEPAATPEASRPDASSETAKKTRRRGTAEREV